MIGKLNAKTVPPLRILSVFNGWLFLCVFIFVISRFIMDMHIDPDSLPFLNSFTECWLVGSLQLRFLFLGQASSYATVHLLHYLPRCLRYTVTCGKTPIQP